MLSGKIEKEIKHENKIVAGLTMRQTICVMIGAALAALLYATVHVDFFQLLPVYVLIAVIVGAFGWIEKDGMKLEELLFKKAKSIVYHNTRLRYRTGNKYVQLFNRGYAQARKTAAAQEQSKSPEKKRSASNKKKSQKKDSKSVIPKSKIRLYS